MEKSYWEFSSPHFCYGKGALEFLEDLVFEKCFIVTDEGIIKAGLLDLLTRRLKKIKKPYEVFSEVQPDPQEKTILRGAQVCQTFAPDLIIALGGGSAMDAAKAIWGLYERPDLSVDELNPFVRLNLGEKAEFLAIPTTSGTGSEATWAIIVTRELEPGKFQKLELATREVVPTYAILDPQFTLGLPPRLTAISGLDALVHLLEGLLSRFANDFSEGIGITALRNLFDYLPIAYTNGEDLTARSKMQIAAAMAGLSFGNSQVSIGHTFAHALGAEFHLPHGLLVGVLLPYILEYMIRNPESEWAKKELAKIARMSGIAEWGDSNDACCEKVLGKIHDLMKSLDVSPKLADHGISKDQLLAAMDDLLALIHDSISLVMSSRLPTDEEVKDLLLYAIEGKSVDF